MLFEQIIANNSSHQPYKYINTEIAENALLAELKARLKKSISAFTYANREPMGRIALASADCKHRVEL